MTLNGYLQLGLYVAVLLLLVKPLGWYMARVYTGESSLLDRVVRPVERGISRLCGVCPDAEMTWKIYAVAVLLFNATGLLLLYLLQRLQSVLPLNPQALDSIAPDLAFNTAISFATNTKSRRTAGACASIRSAANTRTPQGFLRGDGGRGQNLRHA